MKRRTVNQWRDFEELVFRIILIILLALGGMKLIIPEVKELMAKLEARGGAPAEATQGAQSTSPGEAMGRK